MSRKLLVTTTLHGGRDGDDTARQASATTPGLRRSLSVWQAAIIGVLAAPGTARRLGAALAAREGITETAPENVSR